jgi:aminoglycoside 6'-N-acetyltransferase
LTPTLALPFLDCGDGLALKALTEADLPVIAGMLRDPDISEWYGDDHAESLAEIADHIDDPMVAPFLVTLNGAPIGYLQAYHANRDAFWQAFGVPAETWGLDMMLAAHRGQGLGRRLCRHMIDYLFTLPGVVRVQIDPDPENLRAVRCYAAAGFKPRGIMPGYDGVQMVYMTVERVSGP